MGASYMQNNENVKQRPIKSTLRAMSGRYYHNVFYITWDNTKKYSIKEFALFIYAT